MMELINKPVFRYCSSLKTIKIPSSVEVIENGAFADCESLEIIELPSSIIILNDELFHGCSSLKKIVILSPKFFWVVHLYQKLNALVIVLY